jgi:hypothetical protein
MCYTMTCQQKRDNKNQAMSFAAHRLILAKEAITGELSLLAPALPAETHAYNKEREG